MVLESNIHHPNDSSLLGDCVRVFTRLMKKSNEKFGLSFKSRRLRAKRHVLDISNAKSMKERTPLYRDLLKITKETVTEVKQVAAQLDRVECETVMEATAAQAIAAEIQHFLPLASQVISQTERRVLGGESVPAAEKSYPSSSRTPASS
jgi:IS5 family transposase